MNTEQHSDLVYAFDKFLKDLSVLRVERTYSMRQELWLAFKAGAEWVLANVRKINAGETVRPDAEALEAVPDLRGKNALVLYFDNDADRTEFVALVQEAKPGMRTVKL